MIHASAVCSRSNSLTWISPWRAVDFQWMRFMLSPGAYGRTVVASGVVWSVRSGDGVAALEAGRRQAPHRQRLEPRVDDDADALPDRRRGLEEPERVAGPDVQRLDAEVAAPGERRPDRATTARPTAQRDGPAGQAAGQRRRVVDLQPGLRDAAAVAERVGHAHPVADVAVQLADGVAGLEIREAEADEDVRAADDEDAEVEQVEQEGPGRSRTPRRPGSSTRTSACSRRNIVLARLLAR